MEKQSIPNVKYTRIVQNVTSPRSATTPIIGPIIPAITPLDIPECKRLVIDQCTKNGTNHHSNNSSRNRYCRIVGWKGVAKDGSNCDPHYSTT